MMPGYFLVCPADANLTFDTNERPRCRDAATNTVSAWELHHTDELSFGLLDVPEATELQTAFLTSFSIIMIVYLTSWAYGKVISFAEQESEKT